MLIYEECRHEESTPQVKALERAFKKSSEGQTDPREERRRLSSVDGEYVNAAEDLAAEAEAALRKAHKYTDAAGGKPSASETV